MLPGAVKGAYVHLAGLEGSACYQASVRSLVWMNLDLSKACGTVSSTHPASLLLGKEVIIAFIEKSSPLGSLTLSTYIHSWVGACLESSSEAARAWNISGCQGNRDSIVLSFSLSVTLGSIWSAARRSRKPLLKTHVAQDSETTPGKRNSAFYYQSLGPLCPSSPTCLMPAPSTLNIVILWAFALLWQEHW